jgi:hypothetical protein
MKHLLEKLLAPIMASFSRALIRTRDVSHAELKTDSKSSTAFHLKTRTKEVSQLFAVMILFRI